MWRIDPRTHPPCFFDGSLDCPDCPFFNDIERTCCYEEWHDEFWKSRDEGKEWRWDK